MKYFKQNVLAVALSLVAFAALSGDSNFNLPASELQLFKRRPTMRESREALKAPDISLKPLHIAPDQGQKGHTLDSKYWTTLLLRHGPTLVATLEKTFPGATFAFIGRDSQLIADLVEAFYLSIGQNNRVVRIMVSKASFNRVAPEVLVKLVESNGFTFKNIENNYPYIFVDTISKGGGQQGRSLLAALYSAYANGGGEPADLVSKLNMLGLAVSTFQGQPNSPEFINDLKRELQISFLIGPTKSHDYANEFKISAHSETNDNSNEAGYEHFSGAWTGAFGKIVEENGQFEATPGPLSDIHMIRNILWSQKVIWDNVATTTFRDQVISEAKRLGYQFTFTRPLPETIKLGALRNNLNQLILNDLALNDQKFKVSAATFSEFEAIFTQLSPMTKHQIALYDQQAGASGALNAFQNYWNQFYARTSDVNRSGFLANFFNVLQVAHTKSLVTKADLAYALLHALNENIRITSTVVEEYSRLAALVPTFEESVKAIILADRSSPQAHLMFEKLKIYSQVKTSMKGKLCETYLK